MPVSAAGDEREHAQPSFKEVIVQCSVKALFGNPRTEHVNRIVIAQNGVWRRMSMHNRIV